MNGSRQVDLVLGVYAAWNRGDWAAVLDILDEDVVFDVGVEGRLDGIAAVRGYVRALPEMFAQLEYAVGEVRDSGEAVLALVRSSARGRASGVAINANTGHLWRFAGERVTHFRVYPDRADAVAAFEAG